MGGPVTAGLMLALQAALMAGMALLLAVLSGNGRARRPALGPAMAQVRHDLVRLWRKGRVVPAGASFLFAAAPVVAVALAAVAALLVPSFASGLGVSPAADLLLVAMLLAVSRAVLALAAWDAGSARLVQAGAEGLLARLGAVPVLLLVAMSLALLSGGTNLDAALAAIRDGGPGARLSGALAGAAVFAALLGPAAGIEPWSGRLRALAMLAGHLRSTAALSVGAAIGLPFGVAAAGAGPEAWGVGIACWLLKLGTLGLLAAAIGPQRLALPVAALLAGMAVVAAGLQVAA